MLFLFFFFFFFFFSVIFLSFWNRSDDTMYFVLMIRWWSCQAGEMVEHVVIAACFSSRTGGGGEVSPIQDGAHMHSLWKASFAFRGNVRRPFTHLHGEILDEEARPDWSRSAAIQLLWKRPDWDSFTPDIGHSNGHYEAERFGALIRTKRLLIEVVHEGLPRGIVVFWVLSAWWFQFCEPWILSLCHPFFELFLFEKKSKPTAT